MECNLITGIYITSQSQVLPTQGKGIIHDMHTMWLGSWELALKVILKKLKDAKKMIQDEKQHKSKLENLRNELTEIKKNQKQKKKILEMKTKLEETQE